MVVGWRRGLDVCIRDVTRTSALMSVERIGAVLFVYARPKYTAGPQGYLSWLTNTVGRARRHIMAGEELVVMGDLNIGPDDHRLQAMCEMLQTVRVSNNEPTWRGRNSSTVIDHTLVTEGLQSRVVHCGPCTSQARDAGYFGSDHRPMQLHLRAAPVGGMEGMQFLARAKWSPQHQAAFTTCVQADRAWQEFSQHIEAANAEGAAGTLQSILKRACIQCAMWQQRPPKGVRPFGLDAAAKEAKQARFRRAALRGDAPHLLRDLRRQSMAAARAQVPEVLRATAPGAGP